MKTEFLISIPLGAIKTEGVAPLQEQYRQFQFHLVRLKLIAAIRASSQRLHFNSTWCD